MTEAGNVNDRSAPSPSPQSAGLDQSKLRGKRGAGKRGGRSQSEIGDLQRQTKPRIDRAMTGFGDGTERAMCLGVISSPPRLYPVQHRSGLAVRILETVARVEGAILLCYGQHDGPHIWPSGDVAGEERAVDVPTPGRETGSK